MESVAAFTDTYLPTVNGVTYTLSTWRDRWHARGGRMDIIYPEAGPHEPAPGERPVQSVPFPFYDGYRLGLPRIPPGVAGVDLVHIHTPFSLGIAGLRYARKADVPLIASYHTPTGEYAQYLAPFSIGVKAIRAASERWERWLLDHADHVLAPSEATRSHLTETVRTTTDITVLPNGVDTNHFRPVNPATFLASHNLPDQPLIGYTGRHGYEKHLKHLIDATAGLDVALVMAGDGPARPMLERHAATKDVDATFLGFLDRAELPAFYSAIDVFGFPSPVETEGIVALEAMACGTPVVGANTGALATTIDHETTGYHFPPGDITSFQAAITRALTNQAELSTGCINHRAEISVDRTIDSLATIYAQLEN